MSINVNDDLLKYDFCKYLNVKSNKINEEYEYDFIDNGLDDNCS